MVPLLLADFSSQLHSPTLSMVGTGNVSLLTGKFSAWVLYPKG